MNQVAEQQDTVHGSLELDWLDDMLNLDWAAYVEADHTDSMSPVTHSAAMQGWQPQYKDATLHYVHVNGTTADPPSQAQVQANGVDTDGTALLPQPHPLPRSQGSDMLCLLEGTMEESSVGHSNIEGSIESTDSGCFVVNVNWYAVSIFDDPLQVFKDFTPQVTAVEQTAAFVASMDTLYRAASFTQWNSPISTDAGISVGTLNQSEGLDLDGNIRRVYNEVVDGTPNDVIKGNDQHLPLENNAQHHITSTSPTSATTTRTPASPSPKQTYPCPLPTCIKTYSRIYDLHRHHRGAHERALKFVCRHDGCPRAVRGFPRKDKRDDHERKMHGKC